MPERHCGDAYIPCRSTRVRYAFRCRRSVSPTRDLHYHHDQEDTADKEDQPIFFRLPLSHRSVLRNLLSICGSCRRDTAETPIFYIAALASTISLRMSPQCLSHRDLHCHDDQEDTADKEDQPINPYHLTSYNALQDIIQVHLFHKIWRSYICTQWGQQPAAIFPGRGYYVYNAAFA